MNILLDTNIILDIMLKRPGLFVGSGRILALIDGQRFTGFITASSISDIYYFTRKSYGEQHARTKLSWLFTCLNILDTTDADCRTALSSHLPDYEDAIQLRSAERAHLDAIITRNKRDFKGSSLPVYTPESFLKSIGSPFLNLP